MSESELIAPPKWLKPVAIVAVIWNIIGLLAFVNQVTMSPEVIAALPDNQRTLIESAPAWLNYAFGIAVIFGTLGSIGLVIAKQWAVPVLTLSLLGVLAQNTYTFILSDAPELLTTAELVLPALVIIIAIALVFMANTLKAKNMLT